MDKTKIEWTDATWNPVVGCTIVSPGCTNCYAMHMAARLERMGGVNGEKYAGLTKASKRGAVWTGVARLYEPALDQPLRWKRPRRIFVNSMSDLFHESLSDADIDRVVEVIALARQHTFQVLTKRPARMRDYFQGLDAGRPIQLGGDVSLRLTKPLPNLWLGISAEDQARADERIPALLDTPAAVRWVSAEPLLGPIDFLATLTKWQAALDRLGVWSSHIRLGQQLINWIVVGGESGPHARPMHPDWPRWIRDMCATTGIPFLFKQWGEYHPAAEHDDRVTGCDGSGYVAVHEDGRREYRPAEAFRFAANPAGDGSWAGMCELGKKAAGRLLDGKTHDEYPA